MGGVAGAAQLRGPRLVLVAQIVTVVACCAAHWPEHPSGAATLCTTRAGSLRASAPAVSYRRRRFCASTPLVLLVLWPTRAPADEDRPCERRPAFAARRSTTTHRLLIRRRDSTCTPSPTSACRAGCSGRRAGCAARSGHWSRATRSRTTCTTGSSSTGTKCRRTAGCRRRASLAIWGGAGVASLGSAIGLAVARVGDTGPRTAPRSGPRRW